MLLDSTGPILVVDDDGAIRASVRMILEYEGVQMREAASAREAMDRLDADPSIQVVFTDIKMPGVDGLELLQWIKERYPAIEVVIMSAHGTLQVAIEALRNGAFDFLEKPFTSEAVWRALSRVTRHLESERIIARLTGMIFLSYASEDFDTVSTLADKLTRAAFHPWLDKRNIVGGQEWLDAIERGIRRSCFFVACLSERSVTKGGVLRREMSAALKIRNSLESSEIYLIPLRLEECKIPAPLRSIQAIDYFVPGGWTTLVNAIRMGLLQRRI